MSGYGYGPPPPPPPAAGGHSGGYGHPNSHHQQQGRGGGGGHNHRGRGGHYAGGGRGEYHGSPPAPHYEYNAQPYPSHAPSPYAGPQHPPHGSYGPQQPHWGSDSGHVPPHQLQPAPAPISSSNYHPNYAPQPYPAPQYAQAPSYGPPQPYAAPYQGQPPPSSSNWHTPAHSQQAPYGNGRHRGGYQDGAISKPHMGGPPVHHGYGHESAPPAVSGSYGQPYPPDPRASQYAPQPSYPYPRPSGLPALPRQDGYYGQSPRRGRGGGGHKDSMRGRGGGHHGADKTRHQKPPQNDPSKKPEPPSGGKKKKRKTNTLGLTPGMDSESEDDEGEEKVLTDLIGHEALQVKDIAAFLADRKKNFPTKARVEAKKSAASAQSSEDKAASLEKQADKLRKQLAKVEFSIKRKREQGDEGDDMRDPTSDESSDDEQPEAMSTRSHVAPPPPAKKADVSKHCKYYSTGGTCGKKGKCRFVHDPEVREAAMKEREANNGRLTIRQRLILNDKEQEDLAVLQSIQYLREKGLMTEAKEAEQKAAEGSADRNVQTVPQSSSLPPASASLPPPPIKRQPGSGSGRRNPPPSIIPSADSISAQGLKHYQGWLLKPYGSTNGKQPNSDDLP